MTVAVRQSFAWYIRDVFLCTAPQPQPLTAAHTPLDDLDDLRSFTNHSIVPDFSSIYDIVLPFAFSPLFQTCINTTTICRDCLGGQQTLPIFPFLATPFGILCFSGEIMSNMSTPMNVRSSFSLFMSIRSSVIVFNNILYCIT